MAGSVERQQPRILILTVHHGSGHVVLARALEQALLQCRPDIKVEVVDALAHCTAWFRAYYNSFEIPLKYWPGLWEYIENRQHYGDSTSPRWLYRWGARGLFRFMEAFAPDVVIATEVGLGEFAILHKRHFNAPYFLVGVGALDFDRPWAQPELDLFITAPGEIARQAKSAGIPPERILECGMPVNPAFSLCLDKPTARERLGLERDLPVLLVNFGGTGKRKPRQVLSELHKIQPPVQVVFISRSDENLRKELLRLSAEMPHTRILTWVDNMHEWMAASDLLISRAGGGTVAEALNSGLPMLVFDAPPGDERRICNFVEKEWQTGFWVKHPGELSARIKQLLTRKEEVERLRSNARRQAHPHAARDVAEAIGRVLDRREGNRAHPSQHNGHPIREAA
jgi:processive 1,2-diacylglycerol beta-glucosyltransferase